ISSGLVLPGRLVAASAPRQETALECELRLLDEARVALEAHAGTRALAALDTHAQRFPAGGMRIEASALRIEALFALGERDQAETSPARFSPPIPRARQPCVSG